MFAFLTRKNLSRVLLASFLATAAFGRDTVVRAVDYARFYARLASDYVMDLVPNDHKIRVAEKNLKKVNAALQVVLVGVADAEVARDRVAQETKSLEAEVEAVAARLRRDAPRITAAVDDPANAAFAKATKDLRRRDQILAAKKAHLAALETSVTAARARYAELSDQADHLRVAIELIRADNLRADAEAMHRGSADVDIDEFARLDEFVAELRHDVDVRLRSLALRSSDGEPIEPDVPADIEDAVSYLAAR